MLQVVPDINVLVSALINPSSPPGRIVATWRARQISFITSYTIISKIDQVLHRPVFKPYSITESQIAQLLSALRRQSIITPHDLDLQIVKADPEDDTILIAALEGKAQAIITGDAHLLALHPYQNIPILTPADFVTQNKIP